MSAQPGLKRSRRRTLLDRGEALLVAAILLGWCALVGLGAALLIRWAL